jgi:hypothetical protein
MGGGAGLTAAAGLGIAVARRDAGSPPAGMQDVPVRNPAFRESTETAPGHLVVYCQTSREDVLAYELNSPAAAIWHRCVSHAEFTQGARKILAELCSQGLGDARELTEFISEMIAKGLVFWADGDTKIYFEFQERHA